MEINQVDIKVEVDQFLGSLKEIWSRYRNKYNPNAITFKEIEKINNDTHHRREELKMIIFSLYTETLQSHGEDDLSTKTMLSEYMKILGEKAIDEITNEISDYGGLQVNFHEKLRALNTFFPEGNRNRIRKIMVPKLNTIAEDLKDHHSNCYTYLASDGKYTQKKALWSSLKSNWNAIRYGGSETRDEELQHNVNLLKAIEGKFERAYESLSSNPKTDRKLREVLDKDILSNIIDAISNYQKSDELAKALDALSDVLMQYNIELTSGDYSFLDLSDAELISLYDELVKLVNLFEWKLT